MSSRTWRFSFRENGVGSTMAGMALLAVAGQVQEDTMVRSARVRIHAVQHLATPPSPLAVRLSSSRHELGHLAPCHRQRNH